MILEYMFLKNRWLWFHVLAGGIAAWVFLNWLSGGTAMVLVGVAALFWEAGEFILTDVAKIYGSRQRFFLDALGDIIGALAAALLIVWLF